MPINLDLYSLWNLLFSYPQPQNKLTPFEQALMFCAEALNHKDIGYRDLKTTLEYLWRLSCDRGEKFIPILISVAIAIEALEDRFELKNLPETIEKTSRLYDAAQAREAQKTEPDLRRPLGFELETYSLVYNAKVKEEIRTIPFAQKSDADSFLRAGLNFVAQINKDLSENDKNYVFLPLHVNIGITRKQKKIFYKKKPALIELFSRCVSVGIPVNRAKEGFELLNPGNFLIQKEVEDSHRDDTSKLLECRPFALENVESTPPEFILAFAEFASVLLDHPHFIDETLRVIRALHEDGIFYPYWEKHRYFKDRKIDFSAGSFVVKWHEDTYAVEYEMTRKELMPVLQEFMEGFANNSLYLEKWLSFYRKSTEFYPPLKKSYGYPIL